MKKWIIPILVVLGIIGLISSFRDGDFGNSSSSTSSSSTSKTYDDFDTYYLTTTHSIALGDVPSGTPVYFLGRVNPRDDGSIISIYDSESDFRLKGNYVLNVSYFSKAFTTQPENKFYKIYGFVDDGYLYLLRVEHSGHSWTKK